MNHYKEFCFILFYFILKKEAITKQSTIEQLKIY